MENQVSPRNSLIKQKKTYSKPAIRQVRLVAEEAVLGLCKLGTGAGSRTFCIAYGDLQCVSTASS